MASKKLQMNSCKDNSDYQEDSDSRIRKEFSNHNWLLVKINNRNEGPSNDQKKNSKKGEKKKKVKRPSVRVSLPIEVYHNLKVKRKLNNKTKIAKKSSKNDEMQIIPAKEIYVVRDEGPPITNDKVREVIKWAYITTSNFDNSKDRDNKCYCLPKKPSGVDQSTQTVESRVKENINDIVLQVKKPSLANKIQRADQFSQTTMMCDRFCEKEREILNLIEEFGYTSEDIRMFHRTSLKNNHKLEKLKDNDKKEINDLNLETIEIDDDLEIIEKKSNETEDMPTLDGNKNVQKEGSNTEFSALDSFTTLDRIRLHSDLNKMLLTTFYKLLEIKKKTNDKEIYALAHSLVDRIVVVFIGYVKNILKHLRLPSIIELLDDTEPPPKRRKESHPQPSEDEDREILNILTGSSGQPTNHDSQRQETVVQEHELSSQHQNTTPDYGNLPTLTNNVTQEQYRETQLHSNSYNLYPQVPVNAANPRAGLNFMQRDPRLQNYAPSQPSGSVATQNYQSRANDPPRPAPESGNTYTNYPLPDLETGPNNYEILNQSRSSNNLYLQHSRPTQNSITNNRMSTNNYYKNLYSSNMTIAPAVARAGTSTTVQKPTHPSSLSDVNAQASTSGLSRLLNVRIRSNEYQSSRNHLVVPAAPARPARAAPSAQAHNPAPPTHSAQPAPPARGYTTRDYQYPNAYGTQSNSSGSSTLNSYPSTSPYHHMMPFHSSWHYPYQARGPKPHQPRQ